MYTLDTPRDSRPLGVFSYYKIIMKKSFILYYDSLSVIDKMTDEQVGKLLRMMKSYHNGNEYICNDFSVELVFEQFRNQFDRDKEKYQSVCERNKKIADERWNKQKVPKSTKSTSRKSGIEKVPKSTRNTYSDNDSDSDKYNDTKKENIEYITSKEEMNNFHWTLPAEEQERLKSKKLPLLCLLDVEQRYPIPKNLKFMRDRVEWLTETCTRYWYVDEFGKVTWDTITQKFLRMKEWLQENRQWQKVSIKNTIHTFLNPERQKWKQNK